MSGKQNYPPNDTHARSNYYRQLADNVCSNLKTRQMNGYYTETKEEAVKLALSMIPDGSTVSQGGSMTLDQTGLRAKLLSETRFSFKDPYASDLSKEEQLDLRRQCLLVDVFISSTNAVTTDGVLVNRDGIGNRVCAMAYGPEKVIILTGMNKIVPDVTAALARIDTISAPMNCHRLKRKTPCSQTIECRDCQSPDRICSITTIIDWHWTPDRIHVIFVGEHLGY